MAKMCLNLIAINFKFLQIGIYLHFVFYLVLVAKTSCRCLIGYNYSCNYDTY